MFTRTKKPGAGFAVMPLDKPKEPKYPKPKILLIDLKDDSEVKLRGAGFNIESGSFGRPYRVPKGDKYVPVVPNHNLRNCEEQEIVVIDMVPDDPLDGPTGEKVVSDGEKDWWAKCTTGLLDPRSRVMASYQKTFDRILNHGGVFIVFTDAREHQQISLGYIGYRGLQQDSDIKFDNWSFLSLLNSWNLSIEEDHGEEMTVMVGKTNLALLLTKHLTGANFYCSFKWNYINFIDIWISLAKNKYDLSVAGLLLPDDKRKGILILLPQLRDKFGFLLELVSQVLPLFLPSLFPFVEGARWVERSEYELPAIVDLKKEIEQTNASADKKVQELEKQILTERDKLGYLHDLLKQTDRKLVEAVKRTFELLGFKSIIDVDEEMEKKGETWRDEDLRIEGSPLLLVEVKGIGGMPSDDDALQVGKHIAPRMKQLKRHDIQGLSIINHQRHIPALERENVKTFRDTILTTARKQDIGLLTTWDLYRLARGFLKNGWNHEGVKDIFYCVGRIDPLPRHYALLGTIEQFWEKPSAFSIKLQDGSLRLGDRIAYELPVDFFEEIVQSLQVDGQSVNEASAGSLVGIKTSIPKDQARKGTKVYHVVSTKE